MEKLNKAIEITIKHGSIRSTLLQRMLKVSKQEASELVKKLKKINIDKPYPETL